MSRSPPLALFRSVSTDEVDYYARRSPDAADHSQPSPWRPLPCLSRRAVGFNSSLIGAAQNVLNALHLEAHLADGAPALSYLKIRLGGEANLLGTTTCPRVFHVDDNLIFLESTLPAERSFRIYLVYDAAARSIAMIPSHPWSQHCRPLTPAWLERPSAVARGVLIARDEDGSYALVSMAERTICSDEENYAYETQDVLYLWRSSSPRWDLVTVAAGFPPEFKGHDAGFTYTAFVAFSCGGRAFWANLVRGVMHCSRDALLLSASNGGADLEFGFIKLPVDLPRDLSCNVRCAMELRARMHRTMGRVGDCSIKFVAIDGFFEMLGFADCTVTVWTLSPDHHDDGMATNCWTERLQLSLGGLAEQDEFKKAGLPTNLVPMYPSLSREEDDVVYFVLGEYAPCCSRPAHKGLKEKCGSNVAFAGNTMYLLRVDMRRGVLLGSARLPHPFANSFAFCDLRRYVSAGGSVDGSDR